MSGLRATLAIRVKSQELKLEVVQAIKGVGLAESDLVLKMVDDIDLAQDGSCDLASYLNEEIFKMVGTCLISKPDQILGVLKKQTLLEFAKRISINLKVSAECTKQFLWLLGLAAAGPDPCIYTCLKPFVELTVPYLSIQTISVKREAFVLFYNLSCNFEFRFFNDMVESNPRAMA